MAVMTSPPVFHLEDQLWIVVVNLSLLCKFRITISSSTQQAALLSGQNRTPLPTYPLTVNLKPFVLGSLDILGAAEHRGCQSDLGTGPITVQDLEQPYDMLMQRCQLSVRLQCFLFIYCHLVGDVKAPCFFSHTLLFIEKYFLSDVWAGYFQDVKAVLTEEREKCVKFRVLVVDWMYAARNTNDLEAVSVMFQLRLETFA